MLRHNKPKTIESIALYALLTAVTALSLDIVLPAYSAIRGDFGEIADQELQRSILLFVGGMLIGELLAGALADRWGRRVALAVSVGVFAAGTLICLLAPSYMWLLVGRVVQGLGAAGQKICTRAIIRDRYSGAAMARIMSYVLAVFVALPFVAPALGAVLTQWFGWRSIFIFLGLYCVATFAWFWGRHPETLPSAHSAYSPISFPLAARIFLRHRSCVGLTLTAGFLFGIHLSFISLSPLLFADNYQIVDKFPLYFGGVVCAFGLALILNAKYVERIGMGFMVAVGLLALNVSQLTFLAVSFFQADMPLSLFLVYVFFVLFSLGLVFGNVTALILQPVGSIAGVASALTSAVSTAVALIVSAFAGFFYLGSLWAFVVVCEVATVLALVFFVWSQQKSRPLIS
jgi:DHA1 family bicyclomycin/chloramphenicol resistance-like MFS transporter